MELNRGRVSDRPSGSGEPGDLLQMGDCSMRAGRTGEQVERRLLVVTDRCQRDVLVRSSGWIARDDELEQKEARDHCDNDGMFAERLADEPRPEDKGALARKARAAFRRMPEPEYAALEGMHIFELRRGRKVDEQLDETVDWHSGRHRAAQQRLHMLRSVIDRPSFAIDRFPLLLAHARMRGTDVFDVVFVQVRLHRDALLPENLMILRARQWRQAKELDDIERQFLLNDRDVAPDGLWRVRREAEDVSGKCENALRLPGQQHSSIFGDLVLPLLGSGEVVRIDILETDEHTCDAGTLRLLDEIWDPVAQCVNLDHQAERDSVPFAQRDQAVEDRLPCLVACEIVVGDEEFVDALRPVETHQMFDVVGGAEARLAPLHVDNGAERALIGAAAASIEARTQPKCPLDVLPGKERHRRAFHVRQVAHEIIERRKASGGGILQHKIEATLGLTGKHRNAHLPACIKPDGAAVKHRHTAGHVKSSDCDRDASSAERACYIEGARILVRLDANECKQPKIAVTAKPLDQFGHVDARMRLVNCLDVDRNVRPENLALCAIGCDAVDGGQRIRRNHCAPPAYHVAIVVIVRWLDQNELEASPWRHRDLQTMAHDIPCTGCKTSLPVQPAGDTQYGANRNAQTFLQAEETPRLKTGCGIMNRLPVHAWSGL